MQVSIGLVLLHLEDRWVVITQHGASGLDLSQLDQLEHNLHESHQHLAGALAWMSSFGILARRC